MAGTPLVQCRRRSGIFGRAGLVLSRGAALPFDGLPAGACELQAGKPALLLYADAASRERIVVAMLRQLAAGAGARRATWLTAPGRASPILQDELRAAAQAGVVETLRWSSDAAAQMRELGPGYLLHELAAAGMHRQDLWILDLIEPWTVDPADPAAGSTLEAVLADAMHCLGHWAAEHAGPILALAPASHAGQPLLPLAAHGAVPLLAAFDSTATAARLDVVRWGAHHRPGALRRGLRWEFDATEAGRWRLRADARLDMSGALQAADAHAVHADRAALHDMTALPQGWQAHDSLEGLLAAADSAVAATVIFAFQKPEDLATLAKAVSRLRRRHPRWLRIVVREVRCSLRSHGALALRRLGADALVRGEASPAGLEEAVRELGERSPALDAPADAAQLLQLLCPEAVHGFAAAPAFCASVESMLDRTEGTQLEHSLVHLPLLPHMTAAAALRACTLRRDGDLVTGDESGLYFFLFGCSADDVMATLDSVFAWPCSEVACSVRIDPDSDSQRCTLSDLRARRAGAATPAAGDGRVDSRVLALRSGFA
jgi:cellulose biosynthesis protein BcsE